MYGSPFKQTYGWYLQQRKLESGIFEDAVDYEICTDELRDLLIIDPNTFIERYSQLQMTSPVAARQLYQEFTRQSRQIDRVIENTVRERFGFRPMGSGSTGESILFEIVKRIFPCEAIHRCSRPDFMQGLEFDVFLPGRRLAFEFQGQQHYEPVEHWGGIGALRDLRERDKRKRRLCKKRGVNLVEIRFDEALTEKHVRERIKTLDQTGDHA